MAARSAMARQTASAPCAMSKRRGAVAPLRTAGSSISPSVVRLGSRLSLGAATSTFSTGLDLPAARPSLPRRRQAPLTTTAVFQSTSDNPAFRYGRFDEAKQNDYSSPPHINDNGPTEMTVSGAVDRTALLLIMTAGAATFTWSQIYAGAMSAVAVKALTMNSGIVGLIAALVTTFKPNWSPYSAPVYAIAKGLALGGISAFMELRYPGVVIQALMLTFGTLFGLLTAFRTKMITVNEGFRTFVTVATAGFFIGMLGMLVLQLCGVGVSLMSGPMAMAVSVVSVGLAASNLLLDFDMIQATAWQGAPKWMEWYSGFSLLVTLVWMYTSLLRILSMLSGRDD